MNVLSLTGKRYLMVDDVTGDSDPAVILVGADMLKSLTKMRRLAALFKKYMTTMII
jgi:hypothetical protein